MPKSFYCLQRFFMRVDGVLFRSNEVNQCFSFVHSSPKTRVYHEFGTNYLLREYSHKEAPFKDMTNKGIPLHDPNAVSQFLPVKTLKLEKVHIK